MEKGKQAEGLGQDYRIELRGRIDERWSGWFEGVTVRRVRVVENVTLTRLAVSKADQATLRGILTRIWDLNMDLISVAPVEGEGARRGRPQKTSRESG